MEDVLEIGQIVNTRGLRGEVKLNSFSEDKHRFEKLSKILVKNKKDFTEYEIEKVSYSKTQVILKLKGIDHIDYAEKLRNLYVYARKQDLGELPEGVFYIADLIGLDVFTESGELLGKVDDILKSEKANDVYVVRSNLGILKYLPAIPDVLKDIDVKNKKIIVNLPKGL